MLYFVRITTSMMPLLSLCARPAARHLFSSISLDPLPPRNAYGFSSSLKRFSFCYRFFSTRFLWNSFHRGSPHTVPGNKRKRVEAAPRYFSTLFFRTKSENVYASNESLRGQRYRGWLVKVSRVGTEGGWVGTDDATSILVYGMGFLWDEPKPKGGQPFWVERVVTRSSRSLSRQRAHAAKKILPTNTPFSLFVKEKKSPKLLQNSFSLFSALFLLFNSFFRTRLKINKKSN